MDRNNEILLEIKGLNKIFPGVKALTNVDFTLQKSEIHALMGENGAGKSTVIKVLTGVYKRDGGTIKFNGKEIECTNPLHAQQLGISSVYQEVNLVPNLSVAENIFLGRQPMKPGRIDWKELNLQAEQILNRFDLDIDVEMNMSEFSLAIQQMIAIARALELDSQILILDEPTSSLDLQETGQLFTQMRRLKAEGQSIIFITHFIDQVYQVSDMITVLRNGYYVGTYKTPELSKIDLISKLLGKEMEKLSEVNARKLQSKSDMKKSSGTPFIETTKFGKKDGIKPFDLQIQTGEVVGCAGLLGSGRTEVANLLFGIDNADSGSIKIDGNDTRIQNPRKALQLGIGLSPEDRKAQGIIGDLSVRENIILALQARKGWFKTISRQEQENLALKYIKLLKIKTPSAEQSINNLSGGNQQKVIIARWLAANPRFLIFDEPTRGIDVGAKTEIQKLILELSYKDDMAIMFISSEIEELSRCSSKVIIMHDLELSETLYDKDINDHTIMHSIAERHSND